MTSTTTITTALASVHTVDLGGDLVAVLWEDGHISIEHWEYSYSGNPALDHVRLDADQARELRDFLNRALA